MKRFLSMLLAVLMLLALAGCASEGEKALEKAEELAAAGDYEGAIALLSGVEEYRLIAERLAGYEQAKAKEELGFLEGTWKDIYYGLEISFALDGTAKIDGESIGYGIEDGKLYLDAGIKIYPEIGEFSGCTSIEFDQSVYVKLEDYEKVGPKLVEITLDNWDEYFELRYARNVWENEFHEPEQADFYIGAFLKEEYLDKLIEYYIDGTSTLDVGFELSVEGGRFYLIDGELSESFTVSDKSIPVPYYYEEVYEPRTASVYNHRIGNYYSEISDGNGQVFAEFYLQSRYESNDVIYRYIPDSYDITRAQGSMLLLP